jgi:hydroxymethylpyrimidine pyrophosphatase-like HAD family hydrolase
VEETTPDIRLIATDLDGTLIGNASELPLFSVFRDRMDELRERNGTLWAACSGRTMASFRAFFGPMRQMGVRPDYIVVSHAYIYSLTSMGYRPHVLWSLQVKFHIWQNLRRVRRALDEWRRMLRAIASGVRTVKRDRYRMMVRFDSEASAIQAADVIREKARAYLGVQVFQTTNVVDVVVVPFTKGLAVAELARHLRLRPAHVLTMGNGQNDLSMLEPGVAAHTGCPANSDPEVVEAVHKHGGHISKSETLAGVLDIVAATTAGRVCSELPAGWGQVPRSTTLATIRPRSQKHRRPGQGRGLWLFLAVTYVVLVVFATYGLLPRSVGGVIVKPFHLGLRAVEKLLIHLFGQ